MSQKGPILGLWRTFLFAYADQRWENVVRPGKILINVALTKRAWLCVCPYTEGWSMNPRFMHAMAFAFIAALVGIGIGSTFPPSVALGVQPLLQALANIACSSKSPCQAYTNSSSGPGVQGVSSGGNGVIAQTKFNSTSKTVCARHRCCRQLDIRHGRGRACRQRFWHYHHQRGRRVRRFAEP